MTMNLLADVTTADLIAFTREVPFPNKLDLTQKILPSVYRPIVEYAIGVTKKYTNTAKFRSYDAETPIGKREGSTTTTRGILPPIGQKLKVGELETILLAIAHGQDTQQLIDNVYNDIQTNVDAIRTRLELAAGDLLTDGKFTLLDENGLTLEADWGWQSYQMPTAVTLWDQSGATPLTDERTWIRSLYTQGLNAPDKAVASYRILMAMAQNAEYQREFFGQNYGSGDGKYPTLNPGQLNQVRSTWGLPPIEETYDTQVRVDGSNTRVLADNKFILVPPEGGETLYGITAEAIALNASGNLRIEREDMPGIISTAWEDEEPIGVWSKSTAVAMPVLEDSQSIISATVLAGD